MTGANNEITQIWQFYPSGECVGITGFPLFITGACVGISVGFPVYITGACIWITGFSSVHHRGMCWDYSMALSVYIMGACVWITQWLFQCTLCVGTTL